MTWILYYWWQLVLLEWVYMGAQGCSVASVWYYTNTLFWSCRALICNAWIFLCTRWSHFRSESENTWRGLRTWDKFCTTPWKECVALPWLHSLFWLCSQLTFLRRIVNDLWCRLGNKWSSLHTGGQRGGKHLLSILKSSKRLCCKSLTDTCHREERGGRSPSSSMSVPNSTEQIPPYSEFP